MRACGGVELSCLSSRRSALPPPPPHLIISFREDRYIYSTLTLIRGSSMSFIKEYMVNSSSRLRRHIQVITSTEKQKKGWWIQLMINMKYWWVLLGYRSYYTTHYDYLWKGENLNKEELTVYLMIFKRLTCMMITCKYLERACYRFTH